MGKLLSLTDVLRAQIITLHGEGYTERYRNNVHYFGLSGNKGYLRQHFINLNQYKMNDVINHTSSPRVNHRVAFQKKLFHYTGWERNPGLVCDCTMISSNSMLMARFMTGEGPVVHGKLRSMKTAQ